MDITQKGKITPLSVMVVSKRSGKPVLAMVQSVSIERPCNHASIIRRDFWRVVLHTEHGERSFGFSESAKHLNENTAVCYGYNPRFEEVANWADYRE